MGVNQQIKDIIEATIRPAVLQHGGDVEFVSFENGTVTLRLHGACVGCPLSFYTLKMGIEEQLRSQVPSVEQVVAENI